MTLNFKNLRKLRTHEDPQHYHKILGGFCLINFIYQFTNLIVFGYLPLQISSYKNIIVTMHALLSLSSLIFRVPLNRHKGLPMIYKEFRLHSIVFALRSVLCCYLFAFEFNIIFNILVINLTMLLADLITLNYSVNSQTMRGMPFGNNVNDNDKNKITEMHSVQQFSATLFMLINFETAFVPLLAIQLAAFLMTLVRKSIIKELDWHRLYAISLWLCIFALYTTDLCGVLFIFWSSYYVHFMRITKRFNKYFVWNSMAILHLYIFNNLYPLIKNLETEYITANTTTIIILYYLFKNIYQTRSLWF